MTNAASTPMNPTTCHGLAGRSSALNAPTGLDWAALPSMTSAMMIGRPRNRMQARYSRMKILPPFSPAMYGNRQMFPSPTALPAAARINPIRLPQ